MGIAIAKMGAQPIIEPNDMDNCNRNDVINYRCEWTLIAGPMVAKRGHYVLKIK